VPKLQAQNKELVRRELVGALFQTAFLLFFTKKKGEKRWSAQIVIVFSPRPDSKWHLPALYPHGSGPAGRQNWGFSN
jgi:hypothetical protein